MQPNALHHEEIGKAQSHCQDKISMDPLYGRCFEPHHPDQEA